MLEGLQTGEELVNLSGLLIVRLVISSKSGILAALPLKISQLSNYRVD